MDEAELGSIGVETFDTAYCYCPVVKELGLRGLRGREKFVICTLIRMATVDATVDAKVS